MSVPWCRRQPGPKRGNHQSCDHVARPATGKRPNPTTARCTSSRPKALSGSSAASRPRVLLEDERGTLFISARSDAGNSPALGGGSLPSPSDGGGVNGLSAAGSPSSVLGA